MSEQGFGAEFLEVGIESVEGQERVWGQDRYDVRAFVGHKARKVKSRIPER
jgi:hypothetical protein